MSGTSGQPGGQQGAAPQTGAQIGSQTGPSDWPAGWRERLGGDMAAAVHAVGGLPAQQALLLFLGDSAASPPVVLDALERALVRPGRVRRGQVEGICTLTLLQGVACAGLLPKAVDRSDDVEAASVWRGVLRALVQARQGAGLQGVVACVDANQLRRADDAKALGARIGDMLGRVVPVFGALPPVHVLVAGVQALPGIASIAAEMPPAMFDAPVGTRAGAAVGAPEGTDSAISAIHGGAHSAAAVLGTLAESLRPYRVAAMLKAAAQADKAGHDPDPAAFMAPSLLLQLQTPASAWSMGLLETLGKTVSPVSLAGAWLCATGARPWFLRDLLARLSGEGTR